MAEIHPSGAVYVAIAFLLFTAIVVMAVLFVVLILRHLRNSRQLFHLEQLRALELGQTLNPPNPAELDQKFAHNAFWIAFWMVVAVPSATFTGAAAAVEKTEHSFALGLIIWIFAGLATVAALICATVLMIHSRRRTEFFGPLKTSPAKGMG